MPRASAFIALVLLLSTSQSSAQGALVGRAERQLSITSAKWSVNAVGLNQSVSNVPYLILWSVSGGSAFDFFTLRNTGSISVNSFLLTIEQQRLSGSQSANPVTFEACLGATWNTATSTCPGILTLIGQASDKSLVIGNLSLQSGEEISVRARIQASGRNAFSTTLSTSITRNDIRFPRELNS